MTHHPMGYEATLIDYGDFITDLVSQFDDIIVMHVMGHKHDDEFRLVNIIHNR